MSSVSALIEVYRMEEISKESRADVIMALGTAIDHENAMNVTGQIVYELLKLLVPDHERVADYEAYLARKS
jgi:hypothetical protein